MGWLPLWDDFFYDGKMTRFHIVERYALLYLLHLANISPERGTLLQPPDELEGLCRRALDGERDSLDWPDFWQKLQDRQIIQSRSNGSYRFINWSKYHNFGRVTPAEATARPDADPDSAQEEQRAKWARQKRHQRGEKKPISSAPEDDILTDTDVDIAENVHVAEVDIGVDRVDIAPNVHPTHAHAGIKPPNQNREERIGNKETAKPPNQPMPCAYEQPKTAQEMAWLVGGGGYKDFLGFLTQQGLEQNWAEAACTNIREGPPSGKVQNPYRYVLSVANRLKGQTQQSWPMPVVVPGGRPETEEEKAQRLQQEAEAKAARKATEEAARQERAARMAALAGPVNAKEGGGNGFGIAASA